MVTNSNDWVGRELSGGRYRVDAKLGEGGMGSVYRAYDRNLDDDVVIKVPRRAMLEDPEFAGRFAREIRSLVRLAHPCIVKISDVGEVDSLPFAVMQYLPGKSLEDRQGPEVDGRCQPAAPESIRAWLPGVADALDFVHSQGYVHRDVKPGNILFDAHGHVFLSDFGVAKVLATPGEAPRSSRTAATGAGMVLGTPEYMAPELIMGEGIDGRIDQYALAVTVYEMLSGRRPFEGASPTAILVLQTTQAPPPVTRWSPALSEDLSRVLVKGLAKDPNQRFADCKSFARACLAALAVAPGSHARTGSGSGSGLHRTGSASVPLNCPSCGKVLGLSATTYSELRKAPERRFPCPGCKERLHLSPDGTSLLRAAAAGASSPPRPEGTRKLSALSPSGKAPSPSTGTPTPRSSARPPSPQGGTRLEAVPVLEIQGARESKSAPAGMPVAVYAAAGVAALLAVAVTVGLALSFRPPQPGSIQIRLPAVAEGGVIEIDRAPYDRRTLDQPVDLARGEHEISIRKPGYEPYRTTFQVASGQNPELPVRLVQRPSLAANATSAKPPAANPAPPVATPPPPPDPAPNATGRLVPSPSPSPLVASRTSPDRSPGFTPAKAGDATSAEGDDQEVTPPEGTPAVTGLEITDILPKPEEYKGRHVIPNGLFRLGRRVELPPGGPARLPVSVAGMIVKPDITVHLATTGQPIPLGMTPDLARRLIQANVLTQTYTSQATMPAVWGNNLAILTLLPRKSARDGGWIWAIDRAEFLLDMNFPRIGKGLYQQAFKSVVFTPGESAVGIGKGDDWAKRMGLRFTNNIKAIYKRMKYEQTAAKWNQVNGVMNRMIDSTVQQGVRQEAARAAAFERLQRGGR